MAFGLKNNKNINVYKIHTIQENPQVDLARKRGYRQNAKVFFVLSLPSNFDTPEVFLMYLPSLANYNSPKLKPRYYFNCSSK